MELLRGKIEGFLVKRNRCFGRRNVEGNLGNNGTMVGESVDEEKGDGRLGFAIDNLPRPGGSTAIFGEWGGVDVEDAMGGNVDDFLAKEWRSESYTNIETGF